jgi:hypothetical protein
MSDKKGRGNMKHMTPAAFTLETLNENPNATP